MELTKLLAPITDELPAGYDIREHAEYSEQYYSLRDLRNHVRAEERKVVQLEDLHALAADWKPVREQCLDILQHQSKDVEVMAWLAEAAIRLDGFNGLAQVFKVIDAVVREYWGQLFPLPDEDGIQATLYPLSGLNGDNGEGTLVMPIRMAPFMYSMDGEAVLVWDYIKACELAQVQDQAKRNRRIENGERTVEQLQQLMHGSDSALIRNIADAVHATKQHFASLEDFLNEQCGLDSPPTSAIKNTLAVAQEALKVVCRIDIDAKAVVVPDTTEDEDILEDEQATPEQQAPKSKNRALDPATYYPASRDEALIMTSRLSLFFENTEPHSPLSHQMKRVERWGRMSLAELMEELLDDDNARKQFFRLIGLNPAGGS